MVKASDVGEGLRISSKDVRKALQQEPRSSCWRRQLPREGEGSILKDPYLGDLLPGMSWGQEQDKLETRVLRSQGVGKVQATSSWLSCCRFRPTSSWG